MGKLKPKLNIENKIHVLRAEKKISQEELGKQIDVTRATINSIEKGNYNPSLELAFRLSQFFGVGVEEIFYIINEENKYENDNK